MELWKKNYEKWRSRFGSESSFAEVTLFKAGWDAAEARAFETLAEEALQERANIPKEPEIKYYIIADRRVDEVVQDVALMCLFGLVILTGIRHD